MDGLVSSMFTYVYLQGTPCDLVTGDERRCASADGITPSAHLACTVEMTSVSTPCKCFSSLQSQCHKSHNSEYVSEET